MRLLKIQDRSFRVDDDDEEEMNFVRYLLVISTIAFVSTGAKGQSLRIIGAQTINITQVPYVASLENKTNLICGGAIINKKFILTAAQCVHELKGMVPVPDTVLKIRVGSDYSLSGGEVYRVEEVFPHENFFRSEDIVRADIALVKLSRTLVFSDRVRPIGISFKMPADGELAYVAGYGVQAVEREDEVITTTVSPLPTPIHPVSGLHLAGTSVPIVSNYKCTKLLKTVSIDMLCAGNDSGDKNPCYGDRGDPLVVDQKIVGLASWGVGCISPGHPMVYTNVVLYESWVLEKSCLCTYSA